MLFSVQATAPPGSSKLKRAMSVVANAEADPSQLSKVIELIHYVIEDRGLVAREEKESLSDEATALLLSLRRDGIVPMKAASNGSAERGQKTEERHASGPSIPPRETRRWDVFISHAHEDKAAFVDGLAAELVDRGLTVWYDEDVLEVGDSVRAAIDQGLASSDFGAVVISPNYIRNDWTKRELDGLLALERGRKRLLPVWHGVSYDEVLSYSPTVAGRFAVRSSIGVAAVAEAIARSMNRGMRTSDRSDLSIELEPGPTFLSLVRQLANSRAYAWVVVGTDTETTTKFTDDEVETFIGWLSSLHSGAAVTLANSAFVRAEVHEADQRGSALWVGEAHHGPVMNLLTSLRLTPLAADHGATISLPSLVGWWATVVAALPTLAGNLGLQEVRLGFGLYPYGPNSIPVMGMNFGEAPAATRRAEYHQIPPWHAYVARFDPYDPPGDILEQPIRDLLDMFSYGRTQAVARWVAERLADGSLKDLYRGPDT